MLRVRGAGVGANTIRKRGRPSRWHAAADGQWFHERHPKLLVKPPAGQKPATRQTWLSNQLKRMEAASTRARRRWRMLRAVVRLTSLRTRKDAAGAATDAWPPPADPPPAPPRKPRTDAVADMCQAMTLLTAGRLCVAGSYALHRLLTDGACTALLSVTDAAQPSWVPGDIDVFFALKEASNCDVTRNRLKSAAATCQMALDGSTSVAYRKGNKGVGDYAARYMYGAGPPTASETAGDALALYVRSQLALWHCDEPLTPSHQSPYRVCWTARTMPSTGTPAINLVQIEPCTSFERYASKFYDADHRAGLDAYEGCPRFAQCVMRGFDIVNCRVAYLADGDGSMGLILADEARDALAASELRLSCCAFRGSGAGAVLHQVERIIKYVERGFVLRRRRRMSSLVWMHWLRETFKAFKGTPMPHDAIRLMQRLEALDATLHAQVMEAVWTDGGAVELAADEGAEWRPSREFHSVTLAVRKAVKAVRAAGGEVRTRVAGFEGWRILCRSRARPRRRPSADLYVFPPDVCSGWTSAQLRPTPKAIRSESDLRDRLLARGANHRQTPSSAVSYATSASDDSDDEDATISSLRTAARPVGEPPAAECRSHETGSAEIRQVVLAQRVPTGEVTSLLASTREACLASARAAHIAVSMHGRLAA